MRVFFVADLSSQGELLSVTEYDYASLEKIPGAADVIGRCSAELWKTPEEFEVLLSDENAPMLRWRSTASSAGIATVRQADGQIVSLSLLAAGKNREADATTIEVLQKHLVKELRQTPFEPAFDLLEISQRPLIATMTFVGNGAAREQMIQALADRCFAASYFRYLGLA